MRIEFSLATFTSNAHSINVHLMLIEPIHVKRWITTELQLDRQSTNVGELWKSCGSGVSKHMVHGKECLCCMESFAKAGWKLWCSATGLWLA